MKKILIFSLATLLLCVCLLNKKSFHLNNSVYAYVVNSAGITASSTNPVIANKTNYGVGYNVYVPKSLNINRVRLSYGEGSLSDLTIMSSGSTVRWAGYKEYETACDYPTYAILNSSSGTNYLSYFHTVKVYNESEVWNVSGLSTTGTSSKTYTKTDSLIGGINIGLGDLDISGVGGNLSTNDVAKYAVGNKTGTSGTWGTTGIWGDSNITDDKTDWIQSLAWGPSLYMATNTRDNTVTITLKAPAQSYKNSQPSSDVPIAKDFKLPAITVYWRPAVCNVFPPPVPPDTCPTGYVYNPVTGLCKEAASNGILQGGVFVDSNNNLVRLLSEANDGTARIIKTQDTPFVQIGYKTPSASTFQIINPGNNTCGELGPYLQTGLTPGKYDLYANITGEGWAFSEPQAEQLAIIPWPLNRNNCTFADGQKIQAPNGRNYCIKRDTNGYCTEIKILNNNNVEVTAGNTTYVWFGVRDVGPTPTPTVIPHSAWFQVKGGDLYADGNIADPLPEGEKLNAAINNKASAGTSFFDGALSLSEGEAGKNANSSAFYEVAGFADIKRWFVSSTFNDLGSGNGLTPSDLDKGEGSLGNTAVYLKEGDTTVTDFTNFSGNTVIFINGNLTIDEDITVDEGAFLGFIVSGDISVNPDIIKVQGFYFTDGTFSTGSGDKQITFSGTIVANTGVDLERDLGEAQNPNKPAEIFEYRPDFSFSAPPELRRPYRYYVETPG